MTMTPPHNYLAVIKVVGIGGGGVNAVNRMIEVGLKGVEFIAVNTDAQALLMSDADVKLDIGRELTRGLGAGAAPEVGNQAADDHKDEIEEVLKGADMVFVTAGEGGGTGTGGAPVIASVARKLGALTIGVVTRPFSFEGKRRANQAEQGIKELRDECDTLIVIPNDRLLQLGDIGVSLMDAFRSADEVLLSGVQGITDLITTPGLINLDFADVKSVMSGAGSALMGIGSAHGEGRAVQAAQKAINSPLLEASMEGAHGVLLAIAGGSDLGLFEINESASLVQESAHPEANIIFGTVIDDSLGDEVRVTVIAAGFDAGTPTHKKLDPTKVGSRGAVAAGEAGQVSAGTSPEGRVVDGQVERDDPSAAQGGSVQYSPAAAPPPAQGGEEAAGRQWTEQAPGTVEQPSAGVAREPGPMTGYGPEQYATRAGSQPASAPQPGDRNVTGHQVTGQQVTGQQAGETTPQQTGAPRGPEGPTSGTQQGPTLPSRTAGEAPGAGYGQRVHTDTDDYDDDVDIPPFMRR